MACLPEWFRTYAGQHLDTLPKLIHHVLILLVVCNIILFLGSWKVVMVPDMGWNTPWIAILLSCQTTCCWMIVHDTTATATTTATTTRWGFLRALRPTEFMIGTCFGLCVGASLLAQLLSNYFRNLGQCGDSIMGVPVHEYICGSPRDVAHLASISFWSGLIFWLELCLAILIAMAKNELVRVGSGGSYYHHPYDDLSAQEDPESHFRTYPEPHQQQQQHHQQPSSSSLDPSSDAAAAFGNGGSSFLGSLVGSLPFGTTSTTTSNEYSHVPDIRTAEHASGSTGSTGSSGGYVSGSMPTMNDPLGTHLTV